jgi:hypothetical protein
MRALPLVALLLVACQDAGLQKHNAAPEATITSPADGATMVEGDVVVLTGTVSDPNHDEAELVVSWTLGGGALCPEAAPDAAGVTTCEATLVAGVATIQLQVRDPGGATGTDAITVEAQASGAPEVAITAPEDGTRHYADEPVLLVGTASDAEDGPGALLAAWESSLDGELLAGEPFDGDGTSSLYANLTEGTHGITLVVTDSDGKTGRDQRTAVVGPPNSAPTCTIRAPEDADTVEVGAPLRLAATADDADQPAETLALSWRSDIDGELYAGAPEASGDAELDVSDLSAGEHVLTLLVEDEREARCTASVSVVVGSPPSVAIDAPLGGETFNEGETIAFSASVSDTQDAASDLSLSWADATAGVLDTSPATGTTSGTAAFETGALSPGAHTVTLTAMDSVGLTASDAVAFSVNGLPSAPTIAIEPAAPDTLDELVASVTADAVDPEGDAITYTWAWTQDTAATGISSDTVPESGTSRGEVWQVTVTPHDAGGAGTPGTASVTIGNAEPVITSVALSPSSAQTNDTLTANVSTTDPDGDSVSLSYAWTVDAASVSPTTATLSGVTWFSKDETVEVSVVASDGTDSSAASTDSVVIDNTPPGAPTLSIDPSSPTTTDDIVCTVDVASSDDDADSVTYTMTWTVDGVVYPDDALDTGDTGFAWDGPSTTTWTDDTVPAADVALGIDWTCTATPNDGDDDGTTASASATVSGDCDAASSSMAFGLTHEAYGYCWLLSHPGETCDDVCADAGGSNLANAASSAFADACGSPTSADVSTWFFNNGNPAGWTRTGATGYHTLGYGYTGSAYYGKCAAGTATSHGTFPGDPNGDTTRSLACPCFTL